MTLSPERYAEIAAEVEAELLRMQQPKPKPQLAVSDDVVLRDIDTEQAPGDPGTIARGDPKVSVRAPDPEWLQQRPQLRPGTVTINTAEADRRYWENEAASARDRHQRQQLSEADPMNVWNTHND